MAKKTTWRKTNQMGFATRAIHAGQEPDHVIVMINPDVIELLRSA